MIWSLHQHSSSILNHSQQAHQGPRQLSPAITTGAGAIGPGRETVPCSSCVRVSPGADYLDLSHHTTGFPHAKLLVPRLPEPNAFSQSAPRFVPLTLSSFFKKKMILPRMSTTALHHETQGHNEGGVDMWIGTHQGQATEGEIIIKNKHKARFSFRPATDRINIKS